MILAVALFACTDAPDTGVDTANFDTTRTLETSSFSISYAPDPDPIPFNEYFALALDIDPVPTDFNFDARMPSHGHGMNVDPPESLDGETWRVENALFHMTGHWEVIVLVDGETAVFHTVVEAR